jgi:hypothetical protein
MKEKNLSFFFSLFFSLFPIEMNFQKKKESFQEEKKRFTSLGGLEIMVGMVLHKETRTFF